ncbi:DUF4230 domain-containing protein [Rhizomonospora bruguierae]|uniref:DUF4230 domain-containing protein n=1 Tax=Rhizomonospora bruguierae TaxID=1581705 RepID=UPI001BCEDDE8|nr:DUF4230 domain-containing protein [Micromonospora sp. NBRC 107566]
MSGSSETNGPTREFPEYAAGRARLGSSQVDTDLGWPEGTEEIGRPLAESPLAEAGRTELVEAPPRRGRGLFWLAIIVALLVAAGLGLRSVNIFPDLKNPFSKEQADRSQPPLLLSIKDLSRYVAAQGNFQVVIDLQKDRRYVPDFLLNQRTLFIAAGSVEAYVDFGALTEGNIIRSADGTGVEIRLPGPKLGEPNLDIPASYVFAEQRGLLNRLGDLVGGDPNRQREVYALAEERIAAAARDSHLAQQARDNTTRMLEGLLRGLGYTTVKVTYTAA